MTDVKVETPRDAGSDQDIDKGNRPLTTPPPSLFETRRHQLFPVLDAGQIEAARHFGGTPRRYAPDEILFASGERGAPSFLILSGAVKITRRTGLGEESTVTTHGPGEITGEVSQLAGRPALAEGQARPEGCEAVPFDATALRALVVGSAEVGEIVMRAFILRRVTLIESGAGGPILLGSAGATDLVRLQGFLARNGVPHTTLDPDADADAAHLLERFNVSPQELPIALCPDGTVLRNPSEAELARCLGLLPDLEDKQAYDVAVVGAGPAGLATAVYAASEGLSVLVLDTRAFGGQAGASARIENYLGFPTGISGQALAGRAYTQAQKFGAEMAIPACVQRLDRVRPGAADNDDAAVAPFALELTDERRVTARAVVVASGARYRRPDIPQLSAFEGRGVYYWASPVEAKLCTRQEVVLVGGGNSAGQAVVFLASHAAKVHVLVRGAGLAEGMSRYLIDRVTALPNVELHAETEIVRLLGQRGAKGGLEAVRWRNRRSGAEEERPVRHVFLFIGADPNTDWLAGCRVSLDAKGFVKTGIELTPAELHNDWAALGRAPLPLETSQPGVFAIGDVRAGSVKRVASAVGEGAAVVAQIHGFLAGGGHTASPGSKNNTKGE